MTVSQKQNFFIPVLTLSLVAVIAAAVLGFVHRLTVEPIKRGRDNLELAAIAEVAGEFDNDPLAEKMVLTTANKKHKLTMYPSRRNGHLNAVAIKTYSNTGFGGKVELMAGFNVDGSIRNFRIISTGEIPELGLNIDNPEFKKQLSGFHPDRQILKIKQDGGAVNAVAAAATGSRAVLKALARAFDAFSNFSSGKRYEQ